LEAIVITPGTGDILHSDVDAMVNTVNCVGILGRGIALQFRKAFPDYYRAYQEACKRNELHTGMVLTYKLNRLTKPCYVISFPTKEHWKGKSKIEYIESGLRSLVAEVKLLGIQSIAVPPLGCGLGGLQWSVVRPIIEAAFDELPDVCVTLYAPSGAPESDATVKDSRPPTMTLSRAIMLTLMQRYQAALMDVSISLLEIHKLMYLAQEAGQSLKLRYAKAHYGPYAENLRHALLAIDGHFISGYGDAQDKPTKSIELNTSAAESARIMLEEDPDSRDRVAKVEDLIEGFETPFGTELLTTVHWVAMHEGASTPDEAIERVYGWNPRKKRFTEKHIRLAWSVMQEKGWLAGKGC